LDLRDFLFYVIVTLRQAGVKYKPGAYEEWRSKMKNLPPLTSVIAKGPEAGFEFERLMKKLLIHDGFLKGYVFEPGPTHKDKGIDGIVKQNYPGMKGPVVFQFKWLFGEINKDDAGRQIKNSFDRLLDSGKNFKSYVLVTPHDLTGTEKEWLESLHKKKRIDVYHFGHTEIQVFLDAYPALKKYYYGVETGGAAQNFKTIKEKYRSAISAEVKHLHFLGLPTRHYQRQLELEKPELAKIYIPLDFIAQEESSKTTALHKILENSQRVVVLGDPGSGKSTLAKYLAWIHSHPPDSVDKPGYERRIPFFIPIREFVRMQQERKAEAFNFIDFLKYKAEADYSFCDMDKDFFIALLELGQAIVLFDGLDEVASESGRSRTSKIIQQFSLRYPDSPVWVTSRLVGYTVDVKLDAEMFAHYRLASVSPTQAGDFIAKWYDIQLPKDEQLRQGRVQSLRQAIETNPGVQRLKTNPLLLTMMTLVHQFEGSLPDDRAKLYEKCLELLLNTWQEQKYMALGHKNPLEERDLRRGDQLKMLADAAFYIQARNREARDKVRGLIEERELTQVLFKARYNEKRMTEENALEDVRVFLDYIRDRAGLLVEKGRNKKGENVFAFVHLSFLEYLCAYRIAEDKSKNQDDHIARLLGYLEYPTWEEPILLALYLFDRSTGPSFIDAFSAAVFEKSTGDSTINGWFLLGRAIRDNLRFAHEDIRRITCEIFNLWLERRQEDMDFAILKEIAEFSREGKNILKGVILEAVKNEPTEKAFDSIFLYEKLYKIDPPLVEALAGNKEYSTLLAYLPVYRYKEWVAEYIYKNLEESQWVTYYNSAADKTSEYLEKLLTWPLLRKELKGYIISHWAKLFRAYQERRNFIEINREHLEGLKGIKNICCDFGGYAQVSYPLRLFYPLAEDTEPVHVSKITHQRFLSENKWTYPLNEKFFNSWLCKILANIFWTFEKSISRDEKLPGPYRDLLITKISNLSMDSIKIIDWHIGEDFGSHLNNNVIRDFSRNFSRTFIQDFIRDFSKNFSQNFFKEFKVDFIIQFIRELSLDFICDFTWEISQLRRNSNWDFGYFSHNFSDFISNLYDKKYHEKLDWERLSEMNDRMIYELVKEELEKGEIVFIEKFFNYLGNYLFTYKFELSFHTFGTATQSLSGKGLVGVTHRENFTFMTNPLVLPFTFYFLLTAVLSHYLLNIYADLTRQFHGKEEPNREEIQTAVDDLCKRNPVDFYFLAFSWDFYAQTFNEQYQKQEGSETRDLSLAAFVVSAVRVSLTAGVPCEGEEWDKTLAEAQQSENPFVQISLTHYQLINSTEPAEREKNEALLKQQLANFKADYPEYYRLIGFQEK